MNNLIIGDGGMGSELRFRGVEVPSHVESIWSALALIDNPKVIKQIHLDYIEAGAEYITVNNYAVTQPILERAGMSDQLEDLTLLSISLAKEAIKESGKNIMVAASLPPLETSYRADLIQDTSKMSDQYGELAEILDGQVDIMLCETMANSEEGRAALSSIQNSKAKKWLSWTLHGNKLNKLPSGETVVEAFEAVPDLACDAYLINCCGANLVTESLKELNKLTDKPIGGFANSEMIEAIQNDSSNISAENDHWASASVINEKTYTDEVSKWIDEGATILAGCCRTRPSHIKEMTERLSKK